MPLLLLGGCGDVSNALFLEDAAYVAALPDPDRLRLDLPWAAAEGAPELLTLSLEVESGVSTTLDGVLAGTEALRALAPNERGLASRAWGPYPDAGAWVTAWITRTGTSRYDWEFAATPDVDGEPVPYLGGTHYAGDTVADGDGQFTWEHAAWGEVAGMETFGTVEVHYDVRDDAEVYAVVTDADGVESGRYGWTGTLETGELQYRFDTDVEGDAVTVAVALGWTTTGARADAWIDGVVGAFEDPRWTQCWDPEGQLAFEEDTAGWVEPSGEVAACPYPDPAYPDRLDDVG